MSQTSLDKGKVPSKFLLAPLTVYKNDPSSLYLVSNTARVKNLFNLSTRYDFSSLKLPKDSLVTGKEENDMN